VRELEHGASRRGAASGPEIILGDLPASVRRRVIDGAADPPGSSAEASSSVERFERQFIHEALERHHGNISRPRRNGQYRSTSTLKLA